MIIAGLNVFNQSMNQINQTYEISRKSEGKTYKIKAEINSEDRMNEGLIPFGNE